MSRTRLLVVTYSPGEFLDELLTSVRHASHDAIPVTMVDNGSTDGAPERARDQGRAELVSSGSNLGYGRAVNLGASAATEEWLLVTNPDVRFEAGAVDKLLDAAHRWPRAAALGPGIVTDDGLLYPSARQIPRLRNGVGHALLGWAFPRNPWTVRYRRERHEPVEGRVGWLSGACLLLRREAFEEVGGFDPAYFMFFEDVDLCERLGLAGWDVVYVPESVVVHHGGHATSRNRDAMSWAHHQSAYRYLARRYCGPGLFPVRAVIWAGLRLRYLASRRNDRVLHGAPPTRPAELLPDVPAELLDELAGDGVTSLNQPQETP
ncbi:N-acetylglucosaminyl-diphospho-decaprenol L-rhamnosyltransferase [Phycicoccus ginsengisoli]